MYPSGKLKVMSQIRATVRKSDYGDKSIGEQEDIAKKFVEGFKKKYDVTPELVAFILQKFNAFYLNAALVDSGTSSIPFLEYVDVEKAASDLGYPNIYGTIAHNLVRRGGDEKYSSYRVGVNGRSNLKTASSVFKHEGVHTMLKSASKSDALLGTAVNDPNLKYLVKDLVSETETAFNKLSSLYNRTSGIKSMVDGDLELRLDKRAAAIIDVLKFNAPRREGLSKTASANLYVMQEFKDALFKYAEAKDKLDEVEVLAPETVEKLNRADKKTIVGGDRLTNVKSIRGGFGAIPAGSIFDVTAVLGDNIHLVVARETAEADSDLDVDTEYVIPMKKLVDAGYIRA